MRRPMQLGQMQRPLHLNATRRSAPHASQRKRARRCARTPHRVNRRSSRSTKRGTPRPSGSRARCSPRNVSRWSRTTPWRTLLSGSRRRYRSDGRPGARRPGWDVRRPLGRDADRRVPPKRSLLVGGGTNARASDRRHGLERRVPVSGGRRSERRTDQRWVREGRALRGPPSRAPPTDPCVAYRREEARPRRGSRRAPEGA